MTLSFIHHFNKENTKFKFVLLLLLLLLLFCYVVDKMYSFLGCAVHFLGNSFRTDSMCSL